MAEEIHESDGGSEHPNVRYEQRDASFGWILGIGISTLALGVLILSVLLWFFYHYRNYQATIKRSPFPLAARPSAALPARPRLEQVDRLAGVESPNVYLREAANEEILRSYGATMPELTALAPSAASVAAEPGIGALSAAVRLLAGMRVPYGGFIRIPISRALALLANKLPARPEPPASQRRRENGLVDAGASNSGRMFREKPRWYER